MYQSSIAFNLAFVNVYSSHLFTLSLCHLVTLPGVCMRTIFRRRSVFVPSRAGMIGSYAALGLWTFVVLFPLYWLFVTSFKLPIQVDSGPVYIPFVDFQPS